MESIGQFLEKLALKSRNKYSSSALLKGSGIKQKTRRMLICPECGCKFGFELKYKKDQENKNGKI